MATPSVTYGRLIAPMVIAGTGMALVFAPAANVLLGSVRERESGQASGIHNGLRELGGVFGVAALASVFTHAGGYASGDAFVSGLVPALWVGAGVLMVGAVVALAVPGRTASHSAGTIVHTAIQEAHHADALAPNLAASS